jgi:hypothetical protein
MPIITTSTASALLTNRIPTKRRTKMASGRRKPMTSGSRKPRKPSGRRK